MAAGESIRGLQEAQRWNSRAIANLKPSGEFGRIVQDVITQIQRAEMSEAHVITGAMRASIRMELKGTRGRTYLDPAAVNPRNHARPSRYGEIENARGGRHAFAGNTVTQYSPRIIGQAVQRLGKALT